ncbi:hypothetical protein CBS101457_005158 [Exobasidium rhododendri]|nr:hypothetical protein CBS101457_005158 [Exobasidium rhododendri]
MSTKMLPDKIGSLLFCPSCGSLLDVPGDEDIIKCEPCGMTQDASIYDNLTITTRSHPSAFPSALRQARQLVHTAKISEDDQPQQATIKEMCPKCGTEEEMTFVNVQIRSVDEGSTLFYTCTKCGHKFTLNN